MATCKDCIHYEACKKHGHLKFTANDLYELMYQNGVEHSCTTFKNKADYVEVVRCKDCGAYLEYSHCEHMGLNGFCSRGFRTPKERGGEK